MKVRVYQRPGNPAWLRGRVCAAIALFVGVIAGTSWGQDLAAAQEALFEEEAYPVLEDRCFRCHGGGDKIESDLNLTSRAGLLRGGARGPAIDVDNPESSLLLEMISYVNEDLGMPPTGPLQPWDSGALKEWVLAGAPWPGQMDVDPEAAAPLLDFDPNDPDLWAFLPVRDVTPPEADDPAWNQSPIDRFIYAAVTEAGLTPNPRASKRELIRRAYYDLWGLPPSPEEVEAFVADNSEDAWERLVDRLLDSPHYGEKWGRHWLDLVRYADSHGYERDSNKPFIWRYRDYVIRSINADKPYDQFVMEQLAGDELDNPTPDSLIATGYYRLGLWDDEPADPLLARYDGLDDIADTTSRVFLGLTMGCARCHEHKLDPILQEDYYRFLSFFENITDLKRGREGRDSLVPIATADERREVDRALERWEAEESRVRRTLAEDALSFAAMAARSDSALLEGAGPEPTFLSDTRYVAYDIDRVRLKEIARSPAAAEGRLEHDFLTLWPARDRRPIGVRFLSTLNLPETGVYTVRVTVDGAFSVSVGGEERARESRPGTHMARFDIEATGGALPIEIQYAGENAEDGLEITVDGPGIEGRAPLTFPRRTREDISKLIRLTEKRGEDLLGPDAHGHFLDRKKVWDTLQANRPKMPQALGVMERDNEGEESFVRLRGNPHVTGKRVTPGIPAVFAAPDPPMPSPYRGEDTTGRRRQIAEWIASEENPLTARVHVNRIWQHHFGRGIVRSSGNFGAAGTTPTHPELLDWLAAEFVRLGWRQKPLHKQIMMSRAYRMSSRGQEIALAKDPENNLFWRFDMRRLTAEEVRDSILAVSGNLNLAMYGPGIYPELAPEVVATSSKKDELYSSGMWGRSSPEEQARRSVYIHTKRSLRLNLIEDFDGADTDASCPVRFATTQPTQALSLLNSMFTHRQAEAFARRLEREASTASARVARGFELVTSRPATDHEIDRALAFIDALQREDGLREKKALERFCLLLLNLNEFLFLD